MRYQISPENKRNSKKCQTKGPTTNNVASSKSTENGAPNNAVAKFTKIATTTTKIIRTKNDDISKK